ncbi:MAG: AzlD domain-containing protein [Pseudomonadota bacterium]
MTEISDAQVWLVIVLLGIGTYLIRFSFLGLIGDRELAPFTQKLLRFVPVAVMPGLVAPLVVWPAATDGAADPARILAASAALIVGATTKSVLWSVAAGLVTLYTALALL